MFHCKASDCASRLCYAGRDVFLRQRLQQLRVQFQHSDAVEHDFPRRLADGQHGDGDCDSQEALRLLEIFLRRADHHRDHRLHDYVRIASGRRRFVLDEHRRLPSDRRAVRDSADGNLSRNVVQEVRKAPERSFVLHSHAATAGLLDALPKHLRSRLDRLAQRNCSRLVHQHSTASRLSHREHVNSIFVHQLSLRSHHRMSIADGHPCGDFEEVCVAFVLDSLL